MKTSASNEEIKEIYEYRFYLSTKYYAMQLKKDAKEFGEFSKITNILDDGRGFLFKVVGTIDTIKEFYNIYSVWDRVSFDEDNLVKI
jgi:hypothetical protein